MLHRFITISLCFVFALGCLAQTPDLANKPNLTGDALAKWQHQIGRHYEKGTGGVEKDLNKAFEWYKKSADQGYALAQVDVAYFYEHGLGGATLDYTQAFFYYKKAAENGLASAQQKVGSYYELGRGVAVDCKLAIEWYIKAKDNGSVFAENDLKRAKKKCEGPTLPPFSPVIPRMKVINYKLSGYGNTLEKKQTFNLTVYLENEGNGDAEDVVVDIVLPEMTLLLDNNKTMTFNKVKSNDIKTLVYSIIILGDYERNTVPISVNIKERSGSFTENFKLTIGQKYIGSDVDNDIPEVDVQQKNTFAFVVAEENYKYVDPVPYAINDANIFTEYCKKTLGIPVENIILEKDITKDELSRSLEKLKILLNQNKDAKIFFYYAGHGIPGKATSDDKKPSSYLLLNDGESNDTIRGCISLKQLYEELASVKVQYVSVFLDACFTGAKRGGGKLVSDRGVVREVQPVAPESNMIVISAAQGDETAFPYREQQHGLFTYFLLRKLKETSGNVTFGELSQYLKVEVVAKSKLINKTKQTPSINTQINGWEELKLR